MHTSDFVSAEQALALVQERQEEAETTLLRLQQELADLRAARQKTPPAAPLIAGHASRMTRELAVMVQETAELAQDSQALADEMKQAAIMQLVDELLLLEQLRTVVENDDGDLVFQHVAAPTLH